MGDFCRYLSVLFTLAVYANGTIAAPAKPVPAKPKVGLPAATKQQVKPDPAPAAPDVSAPVPAPVAPQPKIAPPPLTPEADPPAAPVSAPPVVPETKGAAASYTDPVGFVGGGTLGVELPMGTPYGEGFAGVLLNPMLSIEFIAGMRVLHYGAITLNLGGSFGSLNIAETTEQENRFTQVSALGLGLRTLPTLFGTSPFSVLFNYYFTDVFSVSKVQFPSGETDMLNSRVIGGTGWAIGAGYDFINVHPIMIGVDATLRSHSYKNLYVRKSDSERKEVPLDEVHGFRSIGLVARLLVVL